MQSINILFLFFSFQLFAAYPTAKPNNNIRGEIVDNQNRLLPTTEYLAFAVDGQGYHRFSESNDFYHGTGYWLQIRSEVSPNENLSINLRTIMYSGTSSDGYAEPIGFYNLLQLSGRLPNKIFGGEISGKVLDIERQTIGKGLLVQDREFFGGLFQWKNQWFKIFLRGTGTGAIVHDDDTYNLEFSFLDDIIGLGALHYGEKSRDGYQFLYSSYSFLDFFSYDFEVGVRNSKWAGLLALQLDFKNEYFSLDTRIEVRIYEDGFGEEIVGQIAQDYVSFDQLDKPYTNIMNAFTQGDDLNIYALKLNLRYKFNHNWRIHYLNELGQFNYNNFKKENYYFYRAGVEYYPLKQREDNMVLFASNKILTDSRAAPPDIPSRTNNPMFTDENYIGLEANFEF